MVAVALGSVMFSVVVVDDACATILLLCLSLLAPAVDENDDKDLVGWAAPARIFCIHGEFARNGTPEVKQTAE